MGSIPYAYGGPKQLQHLAIHVFIKVVVSWVWNDCIINLKAIMENMYVCREYHENFETLKNT